MSYFLHIFLWKEILNALANEHQFRLVAQSCLTLCDLMTVARQASLSITSSWSLLKLMSIDAIQPSHPLSTPSPPAFNLSQHQGLFKWVGFLHQVAEVVEFQLQHQSFQWTFRTDFLQDGLIVSSWTPRDSQVSSPTPQFKSIDSLALSFLYIPTLTWLLEKP